MSGRKDKDIEATERFLSKYFVDRSGTEFYYELYMRATEDNRKDSIVKKELFDNNIAGKYYIEFTLDDRTSVVQNCWRAMGLTCFQVAEGNF